MHLKITYTNENEYEKITSTIKIKYYLDDLTKLNITRHFEVDDGLF